MATAINNINMAPPQARRFQPHLRSHKQVVPGMGSINSSVDMLMVLDEGDTDDGCWRLILQEEGEKPNV